LAEKSPVLLISHVLVLKVLPDTLPHLQRLFLFYLCSEAVSDLEIYNFRASSLAEITQLSQAPYGAQKSYASASISQNTFRGFLFLVVVVSPDFEQDGLSIVEPKLSKSDSLADISTRVTWLCS
jgi:hypothetical protein